MGFHPTITSSHSSTSTLDTETDAARAARQVARLLPLPRAWQPTGTRGRRAGCASGLAGTYVLASEEGTMIVRMLGLAAVADAAWQLVDRKGWTRFWAKSLVRLRKPTRTAKGIAAGELLLGGWLVLRGASGGRSGNAAKFRRSPGHHPITAA